MTFRKTFITAFLGILLVQAAWIVAVPAFRGPDEFDHVFRAEGISHGAFITKEGLPDSHGARTPVRRSVIDAATKVCAQYRYTKYHDCHAYGPTKDGWSYIGTGAGAYNPAYYVVAGSVGRFFHGVGVDYAIRAATALICALLLAWAAALWTRAGPSPWRTLGLAVALTPVLLFSTAIAAPNGVSYAAGLLFWVAGLAYLTRQRDEAPRGFLAAAVVGAVVLCNTHTTGPMWVLVITVTWMLLKPAELWAMAKDRRTWWAIGLIALGGLVSAIWTITSGANLPSSSGPVLEAGTPQLGDLIANEITWLLQTIAVFPLRNEAAPVAVYVLWLVGFVMLVLRGLRSRGRTATVIVWMMFATIGIQTVLTYIGYSTSSYAWQGRYGLPFTVGLALVPALMANESRRPHAPLYGVALGSLVLAAAISVGNVAHSQQDFVVRPWSDHFLGGPILVGLLAALGTVILIRALSANRGPALEPIGGETS